MFKRIYTSLTTPADTGKYLKDKVGYVILYILFLSLLASIPIIIQAGMMKKAPTEINQSFAKALSIKEPNAEIVNFEYVGETIEPFEINGYIAFGAKNTNPTLLGFTLMLEEKGLDVYFAGQVLKSFTYEELELETMNFNLKEDEDALKLENIVNTIYQSLKPQIIISVSFGSVIGTALSGIFLILLFVGLYSFYTPKLLMKYRFILASYSATIYFFTILLNNLFGFQLFSFIGIFIMTLNIRKSFVKIITATLHQQRKEHEENE